MSGKVHMAPDLLSIFLYIFDARSLRIRCVLTQQKHTFVPAEYILGNTAGHISVNSLSFWLIKFLALVTRWPSL